MTTFSTWTLLGGGLAVCAGWLLLIATVRAMLGRSRKPPAHCPVRTPRAYAVGRVSLPRAAGVAAARGPIPAANAPVGGGYRAGQAPPRTWPAHSSRLSDALTGASGRVWVPAPGRGRGAGTPQSTRSNGAPGVAADRAVPGRAFERGTRPGTHQLPAPGRATHTAHQRHDAAPGLVGHWPDGAGVVLAHQPGRAPSRGRVYFGSETWARAAAVNDGPLSEINN